MYLYFALGNSGFFTNTGTSVPMYWNTRNTGTPVPTYRNTGKCEWEDTGNTQCCEDWICHLHICSCSFLCVLSAECKNIWWFTKEISCQPKDISAVGTSWNNKAEVLHFAKQCTKSVICALCRWSCVISLACKIWDSYSGFSEDSCLLWYSSV